MSDNEEDSNVINVEVIDSSEKPEEKVTEEANQETVKHEEEPVKDFSSSEPPTPPVTPELAITSQPKKKSKKKSLIWILVLVLLAGAAATVYFLVLQKDKPTATNNNATQQTTVKEEPKTEEVAIDPALKKFMEPTTGETWLDSPKKVSSLDVFKEKTVADETEFYEVGARDGNTIYLSVQQALGDIVYIYEKSPSGKITLIARPDGAAKYNEDQENYYTDTFKTAVVIDKQTHYDSLTLPQKLELENGYEVSPPSYYPLIGDLVRADDGKSGQFTLVKQYGKSKLEKYTQKYPDTNLTSIGYTLTFPTGTRVSLTYKPLETDLDGYQFSKGMTLSGVKIDPISRGCGNRFTNVTVAEGVTDADMVEVGKSPSGKLVYEPSNPSNPLVVKAYEEFTDYSKDDKTILFSGITKEEFIKNHAVLFHKDKNGQWLAYTRQDLRPGYGCAKPVIYLYPTQAQQVSVRVGADIKVSDPFYNPLFGWNAWAQPNGQLMVSGRQYDSLFWEGPGWGEYPIINAGTVVPTSEAVTTIKHQLALQGLNEKEINDFIEYWQPNLPEKPFVRLTWLNTAQLNALAPLNISPKPDTVIRAFLDYAGLDTSINLPAQQLSAIPRTGFTVIEWGGLATKKLY